MSKTERIAAWCVLGLFGVALVAGVWTIAFVLLDMASPGGWYVTAP